MEVSTKYLVSMISFFVGIIVSFEGFKYAMARGFATVPLAKLAICLLLLGASVFVLKRYNYWNDREQHQRLAKLQINGLQAVLALSVFLLWMLLRFAFFGVSS